MKLRRKSDGALASASEFNTYGLTEVIVYFTDDMTSDYIRNYEVQLKDGTWKDMGQAFRDRDIVPNNMNTRFAYPYNEECRRRGYND